MNVAAFKVEQGRVGNDLGQSDYEYIFCENKIKKEQDAEDVGNRKQGESECFGFVLENKKELNNLYSGHIVKEELVIGPVEIFDLYGKSVNDKTAHQPSGSRKFNCEVCGEIFDLNIALEVHKRKKHSIIALTKKDKENSSPKAKKQKNEGLRQKCDEEHKRKKRSIVILKTKIDKKNSSPKAKKQKNKGLRLKCDEAHKRKKHSIMTLKTKIDEENSSPKAKKEKNEGLRQKCDEAHRRKIHSIMTLKTKIDEENSSPKAKKQKNEGLRQKCDEVHKRKKRNIMTLKTKKGKDKSSPKANKQKNEGLGQKCGDFTCTNCRKTFTIFGNLQKHMKAFHSNEAPQFLCRACGKQFIRKDYLRRHHKVCSSVPKKISKIYESPKAKKQKNKGLGQKCNDDLNDLTCTTCQKTFTISCNLQRHIRSFHNNETLQYLCKACGKQFVRKDYLRRHVQVCSSGSKKTSKIYECVCGKRFRDPSNFGRHKKKYCEQLSVQVLRNCCNKTENSYLLGRHRKFKKHPLFICDYCRKSYTDKRYLEAHIGRHMGFRKHQCATCKKTFLSIFALQRHSITHLDNSYYCTYCNKKFRCQRSCSLHENKNCNKRKEFNGG